MVLADTLELLHILFVFLLLGALGMITYSSVMVARTEEVEKFGIYLSIGNTGGMISGIALVFVGIFGFLSAWEIGWRLTEGWLIAAYASTIVALIVPSVTFKPWGEKATKLMEQAYKEGRVLPEQKEILTGTKYRATEAFMYGLLVFIAYVMVFKPFKPAPSTPGLPKLVVQSKLVTDRFEPFDHFAVVRDAFLESRLGLFVLG